MKSLSSTESVSNKLSQGSISEISGAASSMSGEEGGRLFEAGRLLTFPTFRVGAYSRLGA